MCELRTGDRVEHARRGKGTFLRMDIIDSDVAIVEFDKDSDAAGETLGVTVGLLKKTEEEAK